MRKTEILLWFVILVFLILGLCYGESWADQQYCGGPGSTGCLTIETDGGLVVPSGSGLTFGVVSWDNGSDGIDGSAIEDGSVTSDELATDSVDSDEIAADAVDSDEIAADAVGTDELATDSVDSDELATDSVGTIEIADNVVTDNKIEDPVIGLVYLSGYINVPGGL